MHTCVLYHISKHDKQSFINSLHCQFYSHYVSFSLCLHVGSFLFVCVCVCALRRVQSTQPLVSPGACVRALAAVEGQEDALIGSTDDGHLVLW